MDSSQSDRRNSDDTARTIFSDTRAASRVSGVYRSQSLATLMLHLHQVLAHVPQPLRLNPFCTLEDVGSNLTQGNNLPARTVDARHQDLEQEVVFCTAQKDVTAGARAVLRCLSVPGSRLYLLTRPLRHPG